MEDMETPTEQAQEDMHHHAHHSTEKWIAWAALSSALLAALAAISVLLAGKNANEAMKLQIESNDRWGQFQAKSVKQLVLKSKLEVLHAMAKPATPEDEKKFKEEHAKDDEKLKDYGSDQDEISNKAKEATEAAEKHLTIHETFAHGVTLFQVAIAVAAISVLSKRSQFWYVGLAFGAIGAYFLVRGLMM